jgi:hypothetical protein
MASEFKRARFGSGVTHPPEAAKSSVRRWLQFLWRLPGLEVLAIQWNVSTVRQIQAQVD